MTVKLQDQASQRIKRLQGNLQGLTRSVFNLKSAIAGLAGAYLLRRAFKSFTEAAEAEETAVMGLHQVLVSMGRYSPQLERKLLDLADALEVQTAFSNDAIITAEKYLATYSNISNDVLPRALKVTLDLARGWNIDPRTAANIR